MLPVIEKLINTEKLIKIRFMLFVKVNSINRHDLQVAAEELKKRIKKLLHFLKLEWSAKSITDLNAARYHYFWKLFTKTITINLASISTNENAACTGCNGLTCTNVEEITIAAVEDLDEESELS